MTKPMPKATNQKSEAWVKAQLKKILKSYGKDCFWFMPQGGYYGKSGIPDFIVCLRGKFVGVETKTDYGKVTDLQQMQMDKIVDAQGTSMVVNESNLPMVKQFLDSL